MRLHFTTTGRSGIGGRLLGRVLSWKGDVRGTTAIEFALVAPILFALMFGVLELALMFAADRVLNGATASAARLGLTGHAEADLGREATIRAYMDRRVAVLLDPSRLRFEVRTFDGFAGINVPEPFDDRNGNGVYDEGEHYDDINGNGRFDKVVGRVGIGGAGAVDYYEASYPWTFLTPVIGRLMSPDGVVELRASAVVQNEPF